ncbi:hypothetical protein AB4Z22_11050 [Paenibacillus sp. TAF58]
MRAMLHAFVQLLPSWEVFLCMALAFAIPYPANNINEILFKYGDQPWKK